MSDDIWSHEVVEALRHQTAETRESVRQLMEADRLGKARQFHLAHTLIRLSEWSLPVEMVRAALYLPWVESNSADWHRLLPSLPSELRSRLADWQRLHYLTAVPERAAVIRNDVYSDKLRGLMRLAYLDLDLVMLFVADHSARLATLLHFGNSDDLSLWHETEQVYIPLLRMLGLWELRRDWIELSMARLASAEYIEHARRLGDTLPNRRKYAELMRLHFEGQPGISFHWRETGPGSTLYRLHESETPSEPYTQITVDILAESTSKCYHSLELANQMGTPIQGRLSDYIANVQPNGYRALHATVVGHRGTEHSSQMLIEFRICTPEMSRLNQWGVVESRYRHATICNSMPVWWNQLCQSPEVIDLIRNQDIGDPPREGYQHIYVFTPRGEVKVLPAGSTVLDFAYKLHSSIGHRSRWARINSLDVTLDQYLGNGDLVQLKLDPFSTGPDPSWLYLTQNPSTHKKIKRGLGAIGRNVHPGRQAIEWSLKKLSEESGFVVPEPRLDKYLALTAESRNFGNVQNLYDAIINRNGQRVSPDALVARILEAELAKAVVDSDGNPILPDLRNPGRFPLQSALRFCACCKPVPGVPLVLHRREVRHREMLTLHRSVSTSELRAISVGISEQRCLAQIPATELDYSIKWGEVSTMRQAFNLTLITKDQPGLIGELLKHIYEDSRLNLIHMEANADPDHMADILFTVEGDSRQHIAQLHNRLVTGIRDMKVSVWPVSSPQHALLRAHPVGQAHNPYSSGNPVRNRQMFFGRESEIMNIRYWLAPEHPAPVIVLHGQRRSGKTSLAWALERVLSGLPLRFVYVDLQWVRDNPSMARVYHRICTDIHEQIFGHTAPQPSQPSLATFYKAPGDVMRRYLRAVQEHIKPRRLMLMLDEFNLLVEEGRTSRKLEPIFSQLRALVTSDCDWLSLLLITHSSHYRLTDSSHPVLKLYEISQELELPTLQQEEAKRLVREPVRGYIKYDETVANQIITRTDGNPYLINLICYDLVQQAGADGRAYIRQDDLAQSVQHLLKSGETYFSFLTERLSGAGRGLVAAIAHLQVSPADFIPLTECVGAAHLSLTKGESTAQYLFELGILDRRHVEQRGSAVRIRIDYFRQWVQQNWISTTEEGRR